MINLRGTSCFPETGATEFWVSSLQPLTHTRAITYLQAADPLAGLTSHVSRVVCTHDREGSRSWQQADRTSAAISIMDSETRLGDHVESKAYG